MGFEPILTHPQCVVLPLHHRHRSADEILPQAEHTAKQRVDRLLELQQRQYLAFHHLASFHKAQAGIQFASHFIVWLIADADL